MSDEGKVPILKEEARSLVKIYLTDDQWSFLHKEAKKRGLYIPALVERIVAEAIKTAKEAERSNKQ